MAKKVQLSRERIERIYSSAPDTFKPEFGWYEMTLPRGSRAPKKHSIVRLGEKHYVIGDAADMAGKPNSWMVRAVELPQGWEAVK